MSRADAGHFYRLYEEDGPPSRQDEVARAVILERVDGVSPDVQVEHPSDVRADTEEIGSEWAPPAPLTTTIEPPPFPLNEAFPPTLARIRDFIEATGEAIQVSVDLPAMGLLPRVAVAMAGGFEIELGADWREVSALWVVTLLESGNRKSEADRRLNRPLHGWEREEARRLGPEIARREEALAIKQARLKRVRQCAATKNAGPEAREEAEGLAVEIAEDIIPAVPQLTTSEPTTEAVGGLLVRNGERLLVASSEGDALDVMLGRYNRGVPNFGIYLAGHSGDTYRVDRRGREPDHLERPALSVGLCIQPEAVEGIFGSRQARGRGLLARFLKVAPRSLMGQRAIVPAPVPANLTEAYELAIGALLRMEVQDGPIIVGLSPGAAELFGEFRRMIEPDLGRYGDLGEAQDWGSKLPGAVGRIALVLHGLEIGLCARSARDPVQEETMQAALTWAPYLIQHERVVAGMVGSDPTAVVAERVVRWLRRKLCSTFTRRDAFSACRRMDLQRVDEIEPALELLEETGYVRLEIVKSSGPGRPPSPRFLVNPRVLGSDP